MSKSFERRYVMTELAISIGKLAIGFLCILGPFVLLVAFLRRRDMRETALSTRALQELNSPNLRGLFALKIKSNPFLGEVVAVDLWNCSRDQIWDLMQRLSARLPSHIRVEVNGMSDYRTRSTWTLTLKRKASSAACFSQ
jgi:hypothetical protein